MQNNKTVKKCHIYRQFLCCLFHLYVILIFKDKSRQLKEFLKFNLRKMNILAHKKKKVLERKTFRNWFLNFKGEPQHRWFFNEMLIFVVVFKGFYHEIFLFLLGMHS